MVLRTIAGPSSERYAESAAGWRLQECVGQAEEEAEQDIEERRGERARRQVRHARSTPRRGRPSEPTALTCWVVKEITMIGKSLFDITNNRGGSERFSAVAIERIFNFLYDMDVIKDADPIRARMISRRQKSLDESYASPLSFNQHDLPF